MLAEKVKNEGEFQWSCENGYSYFQGHFLQRPVMVVGKEIRALKPNLMRIVAETGRHEMDFDRLDYLIKHDISLTHWLLRYLNSAAFGWYSPGEIRETLLGESSR